MDWEDFYNSFRKPDFIPGYEIQNRLGGGAFGDVYKARKQSIGKAYAIKFLKIEDDSQRDAVQRELGQVRHFAAIDHPNLVTIEDMGTVMDVPYLIMGYAGEETLARRLKGAQLDRDLALLYFVQTCRGVIALHDRRLVHFDLKPSNIFLKGDVARVGDYGLSKLLTDGRMTLSFGRGTPQYMAPEMLRNRADHRADIYSLGVILYESLTGNLPFESDSHGGLVLREVDNPPEFPPDYPVRLRAATERCLRLSPDDRFDQVSELLDEIDQTARQGDSVRILWDPDEKSSAPPPRRATAAPVSPGPSPGTDIPGQGGEELRQTAADLARASVDVARGVWDGLRGADEDATATQTPPPRPAPAIGQKEPQEDPHPPVADPAPVQPRNARDEAKNKARGVVDKLRHAREFAEAAAMGAPTVGGGAMVPVPPRVDGGFIGTVFSNLLVGLEVLAALVGGLVRGGVRLFRSGGDRLLRRSGGFTVRFIRLSVFLVVMAAFGGIVMAVGMLFAGAMGGR